MAHSEAGSAPMLKPSSRSTETSLSLEAPMTSRLIYFAAATPLIVALAAALPAAAQEPATAQENMWAGWYVGANIGADWGDNNQESTVARGNGVVVIPPADINLINQT